jgi:hypothetical protein
MALAPAKEIPSGIGSYNPISNLTKQYAQPIGQRLFVFVKTNPNCCLPGGVEAVLQHRSFEENNKSYWDSSTSERNFSSDSLIDGMTNASINANQSSEQGTTNETSQDPFGFLHTSTATTTTTATENTNTMGSRTMLFTKMSQPHQQVGNFFSNLAKKTSVNLEKRITNLAIKADQGKNPDLLMIGLYDSTGTQLLSLTEPQILPITDFERMKGVTFSIPLTVPALSPTLEHLNLILKFWIRSGSPLLKQKHYFLGQACISLGQLRQDMKLMSLMTLPLQSNIIVDGQLQLLVCKDMKFPQRYSRGWSLTDADPFSYNGLFRLPLDQSYGFFRKGVWWVATERSSESTIVLPVATCLSQLYSRATQISLFHATSVAQQLLQNRHDVQGPNNAIVQLQVGYLLLRSSPRGSVASISINWQRPDNIFEVELLPPTRVPVHTVQIPFPSNNALATVFYPKVVTDEILPAILQQQGKNPALMLGNVRLLIALTSVVAPPGDPFAPTAPGSQLPNALQEELWQATISLESYINHENSAEPLSLQLFHTKTGALMGNLLLQLSVTLPTTKSTPTSTSTSLGGLVTVMGLDPISDYSLPVLDSEPQAPPTDPQAQRRHQQLKTMGNFISHQYLQTHITNVRSADATLFSQRAESYSKALAFNPQPELVEPSKDQSPKPFRPSSSRSTVELAGIPFNVHAATLAIEKGPSSLAADGLMGAYFQNITCGAPADHARGFSPLFPGGPTGGLRRLEAMRLDHYQRLLDTQNNLIAAVAKYFITARQESKVIFHIPARNKEISNLRWKVFEMSQQLHQITWACAVRRANVFSQALGISLTSYLTSISSSPERCETWARHGYLITYEGLLSAAGKELGMIEDAYVGISMMKAVSVLLVSADSVSSSTKVNLVSSPHLKWITIDVHGVGSATQYLVKVGVDREYYYSRLPDPLRNDTNVRLVPLLFQVGVDIHQAAANTSTNVMAQLSTTMTTSSGNLNSTLRAEVEGDDDEDGDGPSDTDVLVSLNYEAFRKMNAYAHAISPVHGAQDQQQIHPILLSLHAHIVGSSGKMNHGILDEAASVAQTLGGGGVVFCKSGKDRTAMHITFKQAQFIHRFLGDNKSSESQQVYECATRLRVYGTRLPVCEKNVGQAKYAFNTLQVRFMPEMLKPPTHTLAGFLKGGAVFKGGGIES